MPRADCSISQILQWADSYRFATGRWPSQKSGSIAGTICETWSIVDDALRAGTRGLPGGSSLARLFAEHRGVRNLKQLPPLAEEQILAWADAFHARTGQWPTRRSGPIPDTAGETWESVANALDQGGRGLPRCSSLPRLLEQHRGVRNQHHLPPLTEDLILGWADAFYQRSGRWPHCRSGPIPQAPGEKWMNVETALSQGLRSLPGGSSLAKLLAAKRGLRIGNQPPSLTEEQILSWADGYWARTGRWPTVDAGPVAEALAENWRALDTALRTGARSLPGDSSLARLLARQRGVVNRADRPRLHLPDILRWAGAHRRRTGTWPTRTAGPIPEAPGVTWAHVDHALRDGTRGLTGGSSLAHLLARKRGLRNARLLSLSYKRIVAWAKAYHERTGRWPTQTAGAIAEAPGETWRQVDAALRRGGRGLPGNSSLAQLLARKCGARNQANLPPLTIDHILSWADRHHEATGNWPSYSSGPVEGAAGETWRGIALALHKGYRGLAAGQSLARLLYERRGARKQPFLADLSVEQILHWADAHFQRHGQWPTERPGTIPEAPGETWLGVKTALHAGLRGLPGGSSLAQLLAEQRGVRHLHRQPPLTEGQILGWADSHKARTGRWPTSRDGQVVDAPGESWERLDVALRQAKRGLPGGRSLGQLLREARAVRPVRRAVLTVEQIVQWAEAHARRHGAWPTNDAGPVEGVPSLTWTAVDLALRNGLRGLPGGSSLVKVRASHRPPGQLG